MKLDRSRPVNLIYGSNIAKFEQDGIAFDKEGNAIIKEPEKRPTLTLKKNVATGK